MSAAQPRRVRTCRGSHRSAQGLPRAVPTPPAAAGAPAARTCCRGRRADPLPPAKHPAGSATQRLWTARPPRGYQVCVVVGGRPLVPLMASLHGQGSGVALCGVAYKGMEKGKCAVENIVLFLDKLGYDRVVLQHVVTRVFTSGSRQSRATASRGS